ncbi:MerR family transcriptional regulator [Paenibacillus sp. 1011MAR3C5]|uniref:MerR family transcriptional regulator n=1 Tax=Paenibacillus sp. 1011MAR3C5 TaxID=1675787 RepID=UPI000E6CA73D|nr:MerR family transcriptional regulator [Paenibacillus sp. 1011MAR3C5]RJE84718.1 MerR family transcriptional regulator [Paenibacillus sp. 1011MAR3C5]
MKTYSVKELAGLSGVSRRTLQYYDNEGLLTADKNSKGHRMYHEHHLRRLMQINFYKSVGFSLEQIRNKIKQESNDTGEMLKTQSILLHRQLEGIKAKIHGIEVSNKLRSAGYEIPWELLAYLMNTLETDQIDHWSDYDFPEEDFNIFQDVFRTKEEMLDFYNEFRRIVLYAAAYHASQVPVESELAKELGQEWNAMVSRVASKDPRVMGAFMRVDNNRNKWSEGERNLIDEGEPYLAKIVDIYSS